VLSGGGETADPCTTMGASGTYSFWANADYPGDVHYACQNSGASAVDSSNEVAGVAVVGGMISGTYGYLLDAADEHIRWANSDTTLDASTGGYASFNIKVPASTTGNTAIFEIYLGTTDYILVYFDNANSRLILKIYASYGVYDNATAVGSIDDGATHAIQISWGSSHNEINIDAIQDCETDDFGAFAGDFTSIAVGDDQTAIASITDSWRVDDIVVKSGYVNLCP